MDLSQIKGSDFMAMDPAQQAKVLTEVYRTLFFEDVKGWALEGVNILDELGINDYASGHSRIELPLGIMTACIGLLHQCFTTQNRAELQCLSESTEFAAGLSTEIFDHINHLQAVMEQLVTLQTYYFAALKHRKESNRHLINEEGDTRLFSEEELQQDAAVKAEQERLFKERLNEQRAELERAYWGQAEPPELPKEYSSSQLPMPLWSVGFKPEEGN